MRKATVFYIWQSDYPKSRSRIGKALKDVSRSLSNGEIVVGVDQDTRGVGGSPTIDHVIFDKIARADAVVADLTPVGYVDTTNESRRKALPNPNAVLEAGFALAALGPGKTVLVRDEKGPEGELPFDLRQRRTLFFATPSELKGKLEAALELILNEDTPLPGTLSQRADLIRLVATRGGRGSAKYAEQRARIGAELDLIAGRPGDLWSRLAAYHRAPPPSQWRKDWHYGSEPDVMVGDDMRTALLPATPSIKREEAIDRLDRFLRGIGIRAKRTELLNRKMNDKWAPPVNLGGNGARYTDETLLATGLGWLDDVDQFSLDTSAARTAHAEMSGIESIRKFGREVEKLAKELGLIDPCPQPERGPQS